MQLWGIHEFLLLNTCNRVEIIAVVASETAENGILPHSMGFSSLKESKYYIKTGEKAFEHLCLVTAGMLSQTPGENHITAQIKEALETAKTRKWAGNMLQEWISSALFISKEIKNETSSKNRDRRDRSTCPSLPYRQSRKPKHDHDYRNRNPR